MIIRGSAVPLSRWANGLGETRELYLERGSDGEPAWRLSMALCTGSGEFSHLPGVQRSLVLVTGDLLIRFGDADLRPWHPLDPVEFPGDVPVAYETATGVEDLGVMVWGGPAAPLEVRALTGSLVLDSARWRAAVVIRGGAVATAAFTDGPTRLGFRDAVICDEDADYTLHAEWSATVALVGR